MPTAPNTLTTRLFSDFPSIFSSLLSPKQFDQVTAQHRPRGAGIPKLSLWQWVMARVYHEFSRSGSFSASVKRVTRVSISDAALSQRAGSIGMRTIEKILPQVLRPLADKQSHPEAFYQGYRLVALDGTRFNLRNTAAINAQALKTRCARGDGEPAFAHLNAVVLVEVGLHQPLGAAVGWELEGELTLARRVLAETNLPTKTLLMGDRLFGTPSLLWEQTSMLAQTQSAILLRVRSNLKAKPVKQLADGSQLVEIKVRDAQTQATLGTLQVREIHAILEYEGDSKPLEVRFWTTLLDAEAYPASELVALYSARWEQELFFRELKSHLHAKANLLDAQTPETAGQEFLAMLLAAALVAMQRKEVAAQNGVEVLRISFAKVYHKSSALCELIAHAGDLIPRENIAILVERIIEELKTTALIPKRKPRSCPRTVRQPARDWPKTRKYQSKPLIKTITISNP